MPLSGEVHRGVLLMLILVKQFVKIVAETMAITEPIFEFGSLQVSGQEGFADLRPLFPNK